MPAFCRLGRGLLRLRFNFLPEFVPAHKAVSFPAAKCSRENWSQLRCCRPQANLLHGDSQEHSGPAVNRQLFCIRTQHN